MSVVIQAGHVNIASNCEADMRGSTGAPDEAKWTPQIAGRVVARLAGAGVDVRQVDANWNCADDVDQDYAAVLAVHYNSDPPHESGCWVGVGNVTKDGAAEASWRLQQAVIRAYGRSTGLQLRPEWDSVNITEYYLFNTISGPTPFALIECGTGAPGAPDHDLLWGRMDDVAEGIAQGVADFLGVTLHTEPPPPPAPAPAPEPEPPPPPEELTPEEHEVLMRTDATKLESIVVEPGDTVWLPGCYALTAWNAAAQAEDAELEVIAYGLDGGVLGGSGKLALEGNKPDVRGPRPAAGVAKELGATGPCTLGFAHRAGGRVRVSVH